jgi:NADH dehydrogenase
MHYDYLIIATGASSNYFGHQEWQQFAPGLKSLTDAIKVRRVILSAFEAAEREPDEEKRQALLTFVLVGGGPTGVELAGAIAELAHQALRGNFRHIDPNMTRIVLVEGESRVMLSFPASLTSKVQKKLQQLGVELKLGVHVKQVSQRGVEIGDEHLETENIIWTAGVEASPAGTWLHADVDRDGRVKVQSDLSVPGHPTIFALGDTAHALQNGKKLPGLAPVAMQQGKYVATVIADRATGRGHQKRFRYVDKGALATVGRSFGVVEIGYIRFTGFFAWLTWLFVHIFFMISFHNRISVFFQYAWSYFTFQRDARIILSGDSLHQPE